MKKAGTSTKRGVGRPPKPVDQIHTSRLHIVLTDAERAEIDRAAAASGTHLSEWCRAALLRAAKRTAS